LYSAGDVRRLRRIAEALSRGHRPGQVVPLAQPPPHSLLAEPSRASISGGMSGGPAHVPSVSLLPLVRRHDAPGLAPSLLSEAASLGPMELIRQRAVSTL